MKDVITALQASKPWRAWNRYGLARGNVLAGGVAYIALFALIPALTIGFTVFALVLGGRLDLQERVVEYINDTFGNTVIGTSQGEGVVTIDQLVAGDLLTLTGVLGVGVLLLTGLGWIDALRQGIRAVFGLPDEGNPVLRKLLDVVVLAIIGLGVLASVGLTVTLSAASGAVLDWLGVSGAVSRFGVRALVELAALALDVALFLMFFRVLAQVKLPVSDLIGGAVIGAVALHALKLGGGLLLRLVTGNRLAASAFVVVGLLIWFNLMARLTLLAASWAATTAEERRAAAAACEQAPARVTPALAAPAQFTPQISQRAADRTALAAGAVLGGFVVAVTGGLTRGLRRTLLRR